MLKPKKKKITAGALADAIGEIYAHGKHLEAEADRIKTEAKEKTSSLIASEKLDTLPVSHVDGRKWSVGFFTRAPSAQFDETLLRDLYPKDYAKCLVTKTVFDVEMMQRLVKKGSIKKEHVIASTTQAAPSKVLSIKLR